MHAAHYDGTKPPPGSGAATLAVPPSSPNGSKHQANKRHLAMVVHAPSKISAGIDFRPATLASRQEAAWRGIGGEVVRISKREAFEFDYCGPSHLLIVYHRAARNTGDTILEGHPRSTLRDLSRKLTFVPAGSRFYERHEPGGPFRVAFFYFDPSGPLVDAQPGFPTVQPRSRVFFEDRALWETSLKLMQLIEAGPSTCRCYAEALGVVLAHELLLLDNGKDLAGPALRGGLASWQQRAVAHYIEGNLDDHLSLTKLAEVARLSPYHFSRAFKKSFGAPPRRYHMSRRLEWAKRLLAEPSLSVTDIALKVGFADTSSFSVAFRNLVGRSPREYRRGLF
jgi:AraC family transcriptional regulator